jgi:hypothetical protein
VANGGGVSSCFFCWKRAKAFFLFMRSSRAEHGFLRAYGATIPSEHVSLFLASCTPWGSFLCCGIVSLSPMALYVCRVWSLRFSGRLSYMVLEKLRDDCEGFGRYTWTFSRVDIPGRLSSFSSVWGMRNGCSAIRRSSILVVRVLQTRSRWSG